MDKIKVIHFSDFHLGVETYGQVDPSTKLPGRVLDFLDSLDALIDYAVDNDADLVLFTGDAFHKHSPDPTLLREFGERVVKLSEQCPIVLLVGNHDMPGVHEKASAVDIFYTLQVPNVYIGFDYRVYDIDTKNGRIQVATAPYPMVNYFLKPNEKRKSDRYSIIKRKLDLMLKALADSVIPDYPAILMGHFSVNNAIFGSERPMIIGESAEVDIHTLLRPAWDYIALGHIHHHQDLSEIAKEYASAYKEEIYIPPIVYAGSLDRVDFSEEKDPKGFVWVEIDGNGASWEFVEIDARPFVTIEIDVTGAKNQTSKILAAINKRDIKSAIVRMNIVAEEGRGQSINRKAIYNALEDAGVFHIHNISVIEDRYTSPLRIEGDIPYSALTDEEKLDAYFQLLDIPAKNRKKLMMLASDIMEEVDEEGH